ncbi:MAG: carboxypeptidase-like regulatory domain-containing protein [Acidobacteriota bacterium]|nr:carboxypeptidase-like regulatory domain-containing protein [Acidobacteriota bacterium]
MKIKMTHLLTMGLAGWLFAASAGSGQTAPAADPPPTYANENQPDPAPLKLRDVDGVVRGLGGDPMPRASVALFTEQRHDLVASAMSDRNGKFKFAKVDKGMYRVVVRVQGLCTANVPIVVESSLLAHRRLVVTMRAKDIDTCSYGTTK